MFLNEIYILHPSVVADRTDDSYVFIKSYDFIIISS